MIYECNKMGNSSDYKKNNKLTVFFFNTIIKTVVHWLKLVSIKLKSNNQLNLFWTTESLPKFESSILCLMHF